MRRSAWRLQPDVEVGATSARIRSLDLCIDLTEAEAALLVRLRDAVRSGRDERPSWSSWELESLHRMLGHGLVSAPAFTSPVAEIATSGLSTRRWVVPGRRSPGEQWWQRSVSRPG